MRGAPLGRLVMVTLVTSCQASQDVVIDLSSLDLMMLPDVATPDLALPDFNVHDMVPCPAGQALCTAGCVNLASDGKNCGTCGNTCAAGSSCCGGGCVNLQSDVTNCGQCGVACSTAHNTPTCSAGACVLGACTTPFGDCDHNPANGCEANLSVDVNNCGMCNQPCAAPAAFHAVNVGCSGNLCQYFGCTPSYGDCDGSALNGCEASLATNVNCGSCGRPCAPVNGSGSCVASGMGSSWSASCTIAQCNMGYMNCSGIASDGCNVSIYTDPNHCGGCSSCGSPQNATTACRGGACSATCNYGYGSCTSVNGNALYGCNVGPFFTPLPTDAGACADVITTNTVVTADNTIAAGTLANVVDRDPCSYVSSGWAQETVTLDLGSVIAIRGITITTGTFDAGTESYHISASATGQNPTQVGSVSGVGPAQVRPIDFGSSIMMRYINILITGYTGKTQLAEVSAWKCQ